MTRLARVAIDSIASNSHLIPVNVFAVGGYVSPQSSFRWPDANWDRFPDSYHMRINTFGERNVGNVLDVESGAATINDIQPWIESHGGMPNDPLLVYCNRSNRDAAIAARNAARQASNTFAYIWTSTLDGTLTGNAMTQICTARTEAGVAFGDVSLIFNEELISLMAARIGKQ